MKSLKHAVGAILGVDFVPKEDYDKLKREHDKLEESHLDYMHKMDAQIKSLQAKYSKPPDGYYVVYDEDGFAYDKKIYANRLEKSFDYLVFWQNSNLVCVIHADCWSTVFFVREEE